MLNAVVIDEAKLAYFDTVLSKVPERYGGWSAETINTLMADESNLIFIDVRPKDQLEKRGVIDAPNLIHIPLEQIIELKDMWPADKDAMILFYDRLGHQSTIAMTILWSYNYTDVRSLVDGFNGWEDAGYPVTEYAMP
jgi:rhodanese-related sulfurtransferase